VTTVASRIHRTSALTRGPLRRRPGEELIPRATSGITDDLEVGQTARWLPVHRRVAAMNYKFSPSSGDLPTLATLIDSVDAVPASGSRPRSEELQLP